MNLDFGMTCFLGGRGKHKQSSNHATFNSNPVKGRHYVYIYIYTIYHDVFEDDNDDDDDDDSDGDGDGDGDV